MAIQTSFTEKMPGSQDRNDRFLSLLGNDRELDLALLDVKNRVRDLSLRKNNLILSIFGYRFSFAHLGEKYFGIKRSFSSLFHKVSLHIRAVVPISLADQSADFRSRHAVEIPRTPLYALPIEDDYLTSGSFYVFLANEDVERLSDTRASSRPASMQGIHG